MPTWALVLAFNQQLAPPLARRQLVVAIIIIPLRMMLIRGVPATLIQARAFRDPFKVPSSKFSTTHVLV
jgi:hypothetical protein